MKKKLFARWVFYINAGLGLVVLALMFVVPWMVAAWLPMLFGYGLVRGYWLESKLTNRASVWRWAASLLFNCLFLFGIGGGLLGLNLSGESTFFRFFIAFGLFWMVLMAVGSAWAIREVLTHKVGTA